MSERRLSESLRKNTNAFAPPNPMHSRARSAERSLFHDHDDFSAASNHSPQNDNSTLSTAGFGDDDGGRLQRNRLESESSISKQMQALELRRANSDPFENAGRETDDEDDGDKSGIPLSSSPRRHVRASIALPTLNRYPFAETKSRNCWSEPPRDIFMIRGPKYLQDKKKIVCQSFLLQSRGCDLFLSDNPETVGMAK